MQQNAEYDMLLSYHAAFFHVNCRIGQFAKMIAERWIKRLRENKKKGILNIKGKETWGEISHSYDG
nr:hypothetical protein [uncultured Agathobaculum sp.]